MECHSRIQKMAIMEDDGLSWFLKVHEAMEEEDLLLVISMARQIRFRRNVVVFGGQISSPTHVVKCTRDSLADFHSAQSLPIVRAADAVGLGTSHHTACQQWRQPPEGVIKLNWDAAIDRDTKRMGVGVIARDESSTVLVSMCTTVLSIMDPTLVEAVVAWKAVELCCEYGFQRVILEGDTLEIIQALRNAESSWRRYGQLLMDMRTKLNSLQFWMAHHVKSTANKVSHRLAKTALSLSLHKVWNWECHGFI